RQFVLRRRSLVCAGGRKRKRACGERSQRHETDPGVFRHGCFLPPIREIQRATRSRRQRSTEVDPYPSYERGPFAKVTARSLERDSRHLMVGALLVAKILFIY